MAVNEVYNNTLLLPASDGLVTGDDYQLPVNNAAKTLGAISPNWTDVTETLAIKLKIKDVSEIMLVGVQELSGFSMNRANEQRYSGGSNEWVVNLPGAVTYGDITVKHTFTNDTFFLDWVTTGATRGGSPRADIVIYLMPKYSSPLLLELEDAFPVSWELETLNKDDKDKTLMEKVVFTFSKAKIPE